MVHMLGLQRRQVKESRKDSLGLVAVLGCDGPQWGLSGGASDKEPICQCRRCKRQGIDPWVRKIPWRRKWQPTPEFLLGESHGQRSLAGYSPWGHKESGMTERLKQKL